jgi:hypothetical protein
MPHVPQPQHDAAQPVASGQLSVPPACSEMFRDVPRRDGQHVQGSSEMFSSVHRSSEMHSASRNDGTNPKPPSLTPQQLAATRLLTRGLKSSDVAKRLGIAPQTLSRWKRLPGVAVELRCLHEALVRSAASPASIKQQAPPQRALFRSRTRVRIDQLRDRLTRPDSPTAAPQTTTPM